MARSSLMRWTPLRKANPAAHLWEEHGATERYRVFLVSGTPAEVVARWQELASKEVN